ncbi:MAG: beta-lactamase [Sphingobacteriaceae bacterium]|nr:beta-lactamase [Sphingobacteriaceae bacterium]
MPYVDRVKENHDRVLAGEAEANKITSQIWKDIEAQQKNAAVKPDVNNFLGTYTDKWFGDVTVSMKNGKMRFDSKRSFLLTGEMFPYKGSTFIVKWDERSMDADAFVTFSLDSDGKASGMKMKAISPLTDFSYDFHDLDFTRKAR